jgi:hypothetical protein
MEWRITAARSKGEMTPSDFDVCFSNRPSGVRRFQTIRRGSVDITRSIRATLVQVPMPIPVVFKTAQTVLVDDHRL